MGLSLETSSITMGISYGIQLYQRFIPASNHSKKQPYSYKSFVPNPNNEFPE